MKQKALKYKLPDWKKSDNRIFSVVDSELLTVEYSIHTIVDRGLYLRWANPLCKGLGYFRTIEEAQEFAEKHFNEQVEVFFRQIEI